MAPQLGEAPEPPPVQARATAQLTQEKLWAETGLRAGGGPEGGLSQGCWYVPGVFARDESADMTDTKIQLRSGTRSA